MQRLWARRLSSPARSVHWARESGTIFVRQTRALSLWTATGEPLDTFHPDCALRGSHCSVDGQHIVALDERGVVHWFDADLHLVWKQHFQPRPLAVALAPLGHAVALSDESGVRVLDHQGRESWRGSTPRPIRHLVWVPETDALVVAAEFGFVAAFDAKGSFLWRDGLVAHIGGLVVRGDGSECLLACFSDGVRHHVSDRPGCPPLAGTPPCRALDASYHADILCLVSLTGQLVRLVRSAAIWSHTHSLDSPVCGLACDSLAQRAVLASESAELSLVQF